MISRLAGDFQVQSGVIAHSWRQFVGVVHLNDQIFHPRFARAADAEANGRRQTSAIGIFGPGV